jgi:hypothetical protein
VIPLRVVAFTAGLLVLAPAARVGAQQPPDYSGTWKIDRASSQITTGTGIAGLGASGAPNTLYIAHAANGTVVIGSDVNESQARTFRMSNGVVTQRGPESSETVSLSADGQTLTIVVVAARPGGETRSTLTYKKVAREDACEQWPTPCRYAAGSRF